MDLAKLIPNEKMDLIILHPVTGEETDIKITLSCSDSKKYKQIIHRMKNERINKRRSYTSEQIAENDFQLIAECTEAWENMVFEGETLECNVENAKKIYKKVDWLYEQVFSAIGNRNNFL